LLTVIWSVVIVLTFTFGSAYSGVINYFASGETFPILPDFTLPVQLPFSNNQWEIQSPGHPAFPLLPGKHYLVEAHHPQTSLFEQRSQSLIYEQI